mmetsp:Transcript_149331/g.416221  ORF Transcript_149331/g.416221 Transcript_149331/m.416221 type:complete len:358 (+) Transcript_149331:222-1295(+)
MLRGVRFPGLGQKPEREVHRARREGQGAVGPIPARSKAPQVDAKEHAIGLVAKVEVVVPHVARGEHGRDSHRHGDGHIVLAAHLPQRGDHGLRQCAHAHKVPALLWGEDAAGVDALRHQELPVPVGLHYGRHHWPHLGHGLRRAKRPMLPHFPLRRAQGRRDHDAGPAPGLCLREGIHRQALHIHVLGEEDVLKGLGVRQRLRARQMRAALRGLHVRQQVVQEDVPAPLVVQRVHEAEEQRAPAVARGPRTQEPQPPEGAGGQAEGGLVHRSLEELLPSAVEVALHVLDQQRTVDQLRDAQVARHPHPPPVLAPVHEGPHVLRALHLRLLGRRPEHGVPHRRPLQRLPQALRLDGAF